MFQQLLSFEVGLLLPYSGKQDHVVFARQDGQLFYVPDHLIPNGDQALPWKAVRANRVRIKARAKLLEVVKGKHAEYLTMDDWEASGLQVPNDLRRFLAGVVKTQGFAIQVEDISLAERMRDRKVTHHPSAGAVGEPMPPLQPDEPGYTEAVVYQPVLIEEQPDPEAEEELADYFVRARQQVEREGQPVEPTEEGPGAAITVEVDPNANWEFGFDQAQPYVVTDADQGLLIDVGNHRPMAMGEFLFGRKQTYGPRSEPISETPFQDGLDDLDELAQDLAQEFEAFKQRLGQQAKHSIRHVKPVDDVYTALAELTDQVNRLTDAQEYNGLLIRAMLSNQGQTTAWRYAKWMSMAFFGLVTLWCFGAPLWGWGNQTVDQFKAWNERMETFDNATPFFDWPKRKGE